MERLLLVCSECHGVFLKPVYAEGGTHFACGGRLEQIGEAEQIALWGRSRTVTSSRSAQQDLKD